MPGIIEVANLARSQQQNPVSAPLPWPGRNTAQGFARFQILSPLAGANNQTWQFMIRKTV